MRDIPSRWRPLVDYFNVILAPLLATGAGKLFIVEANGPDGDRWTSRRTVAVPLTGEQPAVAAARAVAVLSGATGRRTDPGPDMQSRCGIYYAAAAFGAPRRRDRNLAALGAILLDIDDRDHGGRAGVVAALARLPRPTAVITSGGGLQAAYVLRRAWVFDRTDTARLAATCREYARVTLALQRIAGADNTAWPSHLFRCPQTYHLKDPSRPILVTVEVDPTRRFDVGDFSELTGAAASDRVESATARLLSRLMGPPRTSSARKRLVPLEDHEASGDAKPVVLPKRVSLATVRLLNTGHHPRYERRDGSLDRSRAVCAVALSLLAAGLDEECVASVIAASALRPALDDRGEHAERWLGHQIAAARKFLDSSDGAWRTT